MKLKFNIRFLPVISAFIAVFFMLTVCAAGQGQAPKSPYPRAAKITNRIVKVDLGGGIIYKVSNKVSKQEIDPEDYFEILENCTFDGLDEQPEPIYLQRPVYPPRFDRENITGFAEVSFIVDESGLVENLRVTDSSDIEFAKAAARAVVLWRFKPMTKNGEPVKAAFREKIRFIKIKHTDN